MYSIKREKNNKIMILFPQIFNIDTYVYDMTKVWCWWVFFELLYYK